MRTHLPNLPPAAWLLIGLPALIVGRSLVVAVLPSVVHALVPEVVRTVISVI